MKRLVVVLERFRQHMAIARQGIWLCPGCGNHEVWKTREKNTNQIDRKCSNCSKRARVTLDRSGTGKGRKRNFKIWERDLNISFSEVIEEAKRRNGKRDEVKLKTFKIKSIRNKKTRRGKRKSAKAFSKSLTLVGVNAAGLRSKLTTFKKVVTELKPSVFFIEETKHKEAGKLTLENYVIFELIRKSKDGGGLELGCVKDLQPVFYGFQLISLIDR